MTRVAARDLEKVGDRLVGDGGFGDHLGLDRVVLDVERFVQRTFLPGALRQDPIEEDQEEAAGGGEDEADRREVEHGEGRACDFAAHARHHDVG